ncbi:MAG: ABC transporter substrate-binding protein, partial [Acidimicrobiales bacterium]
MTVLEFGPGGAWSSLDPGQEVHVAASAPLLDAIYGGLFEQDANGTIVPVMAQSYDQSADEKTFTIHLRPGMTFSDGTPFNAAAVKWNFERDLSSTSLCQCVTDFPVQSIDTPDDLTVVLHLT